MSALKLKLSHPVEVGGVVYEEVTLRLPTFDDFRAIIRLNSGRRLKGLKLAARLAELPPRVMEKIIERDEQAATAIGRFLDQQIQSVEELAEGF